MTVREVANAPEERRSFLFIAHILRDGLPRTNERRITRGEVIPPGRERSYTLRSYIPKIDICPPCSQQMGENKINEPMASSLFGNQCRLVVCL